MHGDFMAALPDIERMALAMPEATPNAVSFAVAELREALGMGLSAEEAVGHAEAAATSLPQPDRNGFLLALLVARRRLGADMDFNEGLLRYLAGATAAL
ncbi:MAG: hypothetical protein ACYDBQ_03205 [Thermoplasmatota archaeon]